MLLAQPRSGARYALAGGMIGVACGLADLCWGSPAFPRQADPDEARTEQPGLARVIRYLALLSCAAYVVLSGAAAIALKLRLRWRLPALQLAFLAALAMTAAASVSDVLAGPALNVSRDWQGPNWVWALYGCLAATAATALALWRAMHLAETTDKGLAEHLLAGAPVSDGRAAGTIATGSALIGTGIAMLLLGIAFYAAGDGSDVFGALRDEGVLEWQLEAGSARVGPALTVRWGAQVGVRVEGAGGDVLLQMGAGGVAFVRAALVSSPDDVAKADNSREAGTFVVRDVPGPLSTEQVVERVEVAENGSAVTLGGHVFFVPAVQQELLGGAPLAFTLTLRANPSDTLVGDEDEDVDVERLDFELSLSCDVVGVGRAYLIIASEQEERILGMGESFSYTDLKGGVVPVLTREQGVGRGLQPLSFFLNAATPGVPSGVAAQSTYTAIPHFISTHLRSVSLRNTEFAVMDFSIPSRIAVEVNASSVRGTLLRASSALRLVRAYAASVSGVMRPLPAWTGKGAILGLQGGREVVEAKLARFLSAGVPVAAIWLQDWAGQRETSFGRRLFWNWRVDEDRYPGWFDWVAQLRASHGIRVMTYINPYLASRSPLFTAAEGAGCLLLASDGGVLEQSSATPDFTFGTVDLFAPRCMDWYVGVIRRNLLGCNATAANATACNGVAGWMADFGETLPVGVRGPGAHNAFPQLWAETNRRAIDADATTRAETVFFTRSAALRSPAFTTLQWMGDQLTSWDARDGLHSALIGQLSAGLSGLSHTHSDIGGYTMVDNGRLRYVRCAELLLRWAEYSAFADAVFRTHEGLLPASGAQAWDTDVLPLFARMASVHSRLWPLRARVQQDEPGLPLMRSMWLHFPHDSEALRIKSQFLVGGPDLLVCPVLFPHQNSTRCYLPARSTYQHLFTHELFTTGATATWISCPAPLGSPCALASPALARGILRDLHKLSP